MSGPAPIEGQTLRRAALVAGAALTCALVPLAKVGGDQLNLLTRGWLLAARGVLIPYGNPLSIGGNGPGPVTSWIVGLPLFALHDYRAPIALIAVLHLVALLLVDRATRGAFTPLERATFVALFALSPWRVVASATLWNPNYLYLVGAIHLWSSRLLAKGPRFWPTFAQVVALGLGAELHPSVLLLGALTLLLLWRGRIGFSWPAAACGVVLVGATLVPWVAAVASRPELLGGSDGFPFRGLLLVWPLVKGLTLWLRLPSLMLGRDVLELDFTERLGGAADRWLAPSSHALLAALGFVTVALALAANVAFYRGRMRALTGRAAGDFDPRAWLESYAGLALAAAVLVFAAAPSTPMSWQALPLAVASFLPLAFGVTRVAARWGGSKALAAATVTAALFLFTDLALAAGAPEFRCAGRGTLVFPLRASSPMFEELGIQRACPWPLGVPGGWWPDVLPEESR